MRWPHDMLLGSYLPQAELGISDMDMSSRATTLKCLDWRPEHVRPVQGSN